MSSFTDIRIQDISLISKPDVTVFAKTMYFFVIQMLYLIFFTQLVTGVL